VEATIVAANLFILLLPSGDCLVAESLAQGHGRLADGEGREEPMSDAEMGCVKKMAKLPPDMRSDWRIDPSTIGPSTKASTSGPASNLSLRSR